MSTSEKQEKKKTLTCSELECERKKKQRKKSSRERLTIHVSLHCFANVDDADIFFFSVCDAYIYIEEEKNNINDSLNQHTAMESYDKTFTYFDWQSSKMH